MPFPFVLIWYFTGPLRLNWLYDNDIKINYYAQYNESLANAMVVVMLASIFVKWLILFTVEIPYGKMERVSQAQAQQNNQQNANGRQRSSSLAPPRLRKNTEDVSFKDKILSFLPKSGNYYVKNPTEKEIQEYKNRSKSFAPEEKECRICYSCEADTLINVCGHAAMCKTCAKDVMKKMGTCPLCRVKIDTILIIERINETQVKVLDEIK